MMAAAEIDSCYPCYAEAVYVWLGPLLYLSSNGVFLLIQTPAKARRRRHPETPTLRANGFICRRNYLCFFVFHATHFRSTGTYYQVSYKPAPVKLRAFFFCRQYLFFVAAPMDCYNGIPGYAKTGSFPAKWRAASAVVAVSGVSRPTGLWDHRTVEIDSILSQTRPAAIRWTPCIIPPREWWHGGPLHGTVLVRVKSVFVFGVVLFLVQLL